jgi:hypothetical protein
MYREGVFSMAEFKKSIYETPDCEIKSFDVECIMGGISDDDNDVSDPFDDD